MVIVFIVPSYYNAVQDNDGNPIELLRTSTSSFTIILHGHYNVTMVMTSLNCNGSNKWACQEVCFSPSTKITEELKTFDRKIYFSIKFNK